MYDTITKLEIFSFILYVNLLPAMFNFVSATKEPRISVLSNKKRQLLQYMNVHVTSQSLREKVTKMAHWSYSLIRDMKDPTKQLIRNEFAVVIRDKYPKAQNHFLVLPWESIDTVYELTPKHMPLLVEMHLLGQNAIELCQGSREQFQLGFHMQPSMQRLHLHVISKDFISHCLKTKHHWNIFNTEFFMPINNIMDEIEKSGCIQPRSKQYINSLLDTPMMCNQCNSTFNTIPNLKRHLVVHWNGSGIL
ncbi:aprataxin-like protein [Malaya genurostris]|uniref:aprataxin-like protein n=1 Tax=Malaya genurostris TaxID=325434 RepID=UPI0026F3FCC2|nr:aprataxin-like protein [Malaya genurostris]